MYVLLFKGTVKAVLYRDAMIDKEGGVVRMGKGTCAMFIFVSLLGIVGCKSSKEGSEVESSGSTFVKVTQVKRGEIRTLVPLTGSINPWRKVNIVPDIAGRVERIFVEEGDRVKEGQVLAKLDTRSAELRLQQAQAALDVAQAGFNSASKDWERAQTLRERSAISPQQFEKVQLSYESAKAQLQQARVNLKLAEHQLELAVLKAPFAGIVTGKHINEGEMINPMMAGMGPTPAVLTLMDLSKVKIQVEISEKEMTRIDVGDIAQVMVDTHPGKVFTGTVSNISPVADPVSRTFKVEIIVPNNDLGLRAGMYARVNIVTEEHKDVLLVPAKSILQRDGVDVVFLAEGDEARMRYVETGLSNGEVTEIIAGVKEGDEVIFEGNYGLHDGARIEVSPSAAL